MKPIHDGIHIRSLDGIRFFAAFFVLTSHAFNNMSELNPVFLKYEIISKLANLAMSLFFILSGFVIHYNYQHIAKTRSVKNIKTFLIARFARLYPLFIVLLIADIMLSHDRRTRMLSGDTALLTALPYYLTLTQSWVYKLLANNNLIYQFGPSPSVAWSISTECFFYLIFVCCGGWILKLKTPKAYIATIILLVAIIGLIQLLCLNYSQEIDAFSLHYFGPIADSRINPQDNFLRWLVYFMPYSRVFEFLLGCVAANLFIKLQEKLLSLNEQRFASLATIAAFIVASIAFVINYSSLTYQPLAFSLETLSLAFFIFCLARYRTVFSKLCASSWIAKLGDTSYSIYMLHPMVVVGFKLYCLKHAITATHTIGMMIIAIYLITLILSRLSYRYFEKPMQKGLKKLLN